MDTDDPRALLKAAGVECAEVEAFDSHPGQWGHLAILFPPSIYLHADCDAAILALARLVAEIDAERDAAIHMVKVGGDAYVNLKAENAGLRLRQEVCGNCATFRMWPDYFPRCDVLDREFDAEDIQDRWPDPSGKCVCPGESRWAGRSTP